jgi:hypothetical protein
MKEAHENTIRLPEDDPAGFSQLLYWLYTKQFEYNIIQDVHDCDVAEHNEKFPEPLQGNFAAIHKVCLMAKKFCVEELQNYAIDCLRITLDDCAWGPEELQQAFDQQDPQDPLYRLACLSIRLEFFYKNSESWETMQKESFWSPFAAKSMENMELVLRSLSLHQDKLELARDEDICKIWHTHTETPVCEYGCRSHKFPDASESADTAQATNQQQPTTAAGLATENDSHYSDSDESVAVRWMQWTEVTEIRIGED